jgi:O-antigen biosynthesis protein
MNNEKSHNSYCVVILTYNGLPHLKICIPSILQSVAAAPMPGPVIVVDNGSSDGSIDWIRDNHPEVECVIAERNDYLFSLNKVIANRAEDLTLILNDDMRCETGFITHMLPHFEDQSVFAVAASTRDWEGRHISTGQSIGTLSNFWLYRRWNLEQKKVSLSLYAGGGCSFFRRDYFVQLGGFDPLYRPAYFEDTDLSYRAWKNGWQVIYEPSSIIYHRIGATLEHTEGGRSNLERLMRRNEILFHIKNVEGGIFVVFFLILLPIKMVKNAWMGNHAFWKGALLALPRIPRAFKRRIEQSGLNKVRDQCFLNLIRKTVSDVI